MNSEPAQPMPDRSSANGDCLLLMLPTELLCLIADKLPLDGKLVLRETCSRLRNALEKKFLLSAQTRQFGGFREIQRFLLCIGKDRLDVWACSWCLRFHRNFGSSSSDPAVMDLPRCPNLFPRGPLNLYRLLRLGHQQGHVQLALKYARLADRLVPPYDLHQQLLMQPYSGRTTSLGYSSVAYKIIPRIVAGRFIVYSEYAYRLQSTEVLRTTLGLRRHCCHMGFNNLNRAHIQFLAHFPTPDPSTLLRQFDVVCSDCQMQIDFRQEGTNIRMRTWEDFGTESTLASATFHIAYLPPVRDSSSAETTRELYDSTLESPRLFYSYWGSRFAQVEVNTGLRSESPSNGGGNDSGSGSGSGSGDDSGDDSGSGDEYVLHVTR